MNHWSKIQNHGSKVLLFDRDNKLIIYLRDNKPDIPFPNTWDLLGGGCEENETPEQTAIRELEEEIGIAPKQVYKLSECVLQSGWTAHIFWGHLELSVSELTLNEGQRLEGIDLQDYQNYFQGLYADAIETYIHRKET
jgi:8-oxo-dGTP diphosphatase